jgi:hypothetical protein
MIELNKGHLERLVNFERNADEDDFEEIFGFAGSNLWDKFEVHANKKILDFYRGLDSRNVAKLIDHLNTHTAGPTT